MFTSNNARVMGDTTRRLLPVRLVSNMERPEDRTGFDIPNLAQHVAKHQPQLVVAALTELRAWFVAGCPAEELKPWGSFEAWSHVIRNPLVWAGWPDPAESRALLRADEDEELAAIAAVHTAIEAQRDSGDGTKAKDIARAANEGKHGLAEALAGLPGRRVDTFDARSAGLQLRKARGRVVGGKRLTTTARGRDGRTWEVEAVDSSEPREPMSEPREV